MVKLYSTRLQIEFPVHQIRGAKKRAMTTTSRPNFTSKRRTVWRALCVRECDRSPLAQHTLLTLEQAVRAVEKQIQHLDQIKTWSETIRGHGDKICERTMRMKTEIKAGQESYSLQNPLRW